MKVQNFYELPQYRVLSGLIDDSDAELMGKLFVCARTLASERNLSSEGYRTVMNCMEGAGQSVFHVHMHLLGGRVLSWPPG